MGGKNEKGKTGRKNRKNKRGRKNYLENKINLVVRENSDSEASVYYHII